MINILLCYYSIIVTICKYYSYEYYGYSYLVTTMSITIVGVATAVSGLGVWGLRFRVRSLPSRQGTSGCRIPVSFELFVQVKATVPSRMVFLG